MPHCGACCLQFGKALVDGAPLVENLIERRDYLVKVTLPPGKTLAKPPATKLGNARHARLDFISPATTTNPKIQGTSYFYSVAADSGLLPGMNIAALLPAETIAGGLVVPEAAVVWLHGQAWVYLRTGADTFARREIAPDRPGLGGGYIVTSLPPNARIVIRGA